MGLPSIDIALPTVADAMGHKVTLPIETTAVELAALPKAVLLVKATTPAPRNVGPL